MSLDRHGVAEVFSDNALPRETPPQGADPIGKSVGLADGRADLSCAITTRGSQSKRSSHVGTRKSLLHDGSSPRIPVSRRVVSAIWAATSASRATWSDFIDPA